MRFTNKSYAIKVLAIILLVVMVVSALSVLIMMATTPQFIYYG